MVELHLILILYKNGFFERIVLKSFSAWRSDGGMAQGRRGRGDANGGIAGARGQVVCDWYV